MQPGQLVRLRAFGGEIIERRVVGLKEGVVLVCREEEYEAARREAREPTAVGFPRIAVVDEEPAATS